MQDIILSILSLILSSALITSILGESKPERSTCVFSAVTLTAMAIVFYTMGFVFSTFAALLGAALWLKLFNQKRGK